jgi:hypothetical protein
VTTEEQGVVGKRKRKKSLEEKKQRLRIKTKRENNEKPRSGVGWGGVG